MGGIYSSAAVAAMVLMATVFASAASASAFYNDTGTDGFPATFGVWLTCGTFCNNSWTIRPGGKASRPGLGGRFVLNVPECDETDSHPEVQNHGFALIRAHSAADRYWAIYGSDQDLVGNYDVTWRDYPPNRVPSPETCARGS